MTTKITIKDEIGVLGIMMAFLCGYLFHMVIRIGVIPKILKLLI